MQQRAREQNSATGRQGKNGKGHRATDHVHSKGGSKPEGAATPTLISPAWKRAISTARQRASSTRSVERGERSVSPSRSMARSRSQPRDGSPRGRPLPSPKNRHSSNSSPRRIKSRGNDPGDFAARACSQEQRRDGRSVERGRLADSQWRQPLVKQAKSGPRPSRDMVASRTKSFFHGAGMQRAKVLLPEFVSPSLSSIVWSYAVLVFKDEPFLQAISASAIRTCS